ncbi:MAG: hypothetical protein QOC64_3015, partial [Solirubrobacteraceae bacterium]|nr:hypothetical protein [Solirubrobacteraceae bacterium]
IRLPGRRKFLHISDFFSKRTTGFEPATLSLGS